MLHNHEHPNFSVVANYNKAFGIGIALNLVYVVAEVVFGLRSHSLALIADAGHNLSDILSLGLAWVASYLVKTAPTTRRTYGLRSSSILASLVNAVILLVAMGAIAWEALRRLTVPENIPGGTVMAVAALGVIVNAITAMLFVKGRKQDLNIRGAFLHMAADAGVSLGVVFAGLAISRTGLTWIDPVVSLAIVTVIVVGTWSLFRDSMNLALQAVPKEIDLPRVREYLLSLPHVLAVHDLHIWAMSTTETALTAHLVRSVNDCDCPLLEKAARDLQSQFKIQHATIQFESRDHDCHLASEEEV